MSESNKQFNKPINPPEYKIGEPTSSRDRKFNSYILPIPTTPKLGANTIDRSNVDIIAKNLGHGIGKATSLKEMKRDITQKSDPWAHADEVTIQKYNRSIGEPIGVSTRTEARYLPPRHHHQKNTH